jgi:hypothetical protein
LPLTGALELLPRRGPIDARAGSGGQHSGSIDAGPERDEAAVATAGSLAFLVLAHADPAQVARLLRALPADSHKLVHIDRKSRQFDGFSPGTPNTQFVDQRVDVYWAGFSVVEATLQLIRLALATTAANRLILLSGNCYPIKSNAEILAFFASDPTREYINYYDVRAASDVYKDKIRRIFISEDVIARKTHIARPEILKVLSRAASRAAGFAQRDWRGALNGLVPAFGSQWWALTRSCAEMVIDAAETRRELEIFRFTFAPDEMYFHTIVANSKFHDRAGGFRPFAGRGNWKLANLHHLSRTSLHKVYTIHDWHEIEGSERLFVRKLESRASAELVQKIERELRGNGTL